MVHSIEAYCLRLEPRWFYARVLCPFNSVQNVAPLLVVIEFRVR